MAYKKLVINGEEFPLPSKVSDLENDSGFITGNDVPKKLSELENDAGYLKSQGEAAFIAYGADGEVSIGASVGVNISSGGSVTIDGNNAAVIKSYSDVAATFNGQRISNIAKPVSDDDAVTLRYLNDMGYLKSGGGNNIHLSALETKIGGGSFVVDALAYGMSVSGNRIQNVGTPIADNDSTTKKYVDDLIGGVSTALDNIIALQNAKIER